MTVATFLCSVVPLTLPWDMTRPVIPTEEAHIQEVLRRLREHFYVWAPPGTEGHGYRLADFAYYEGCDRPDDCCRAILGEAAPFALGQESAPQPRLPRVDAPRRRCLAVRRRAPGAAAADLPSLAGRRLLERRGVRPRQRAEAGGRL